MNTIVPSVLYVRKSARFVGEDITSFSSVPTISAGSASFGPSLATASAPGTSSTSFSWSGLGKGLLDLGGTVATGLANLNLQKAQLKAQAQASRPIIYGSASPTGGVPYYGGGGAPASAPMSGTTKALLYGGGALALGLVAVMLLRRK